MQLHATIRSRLSSAFALDVSFDVPAGITIVFGASGSGKSTLLKSIAGLVMPQGGRLTVRGQTLFDADCSVALPPQKRNVGFVFQHLALFPHLTVQENLEFGLNAHPQDDTRQRLDQIGSRF